MDWKKQSILLTGGTGSFGHAFVRTMLEQYHPQRLAIFSRDELKQHDMATSSGFNHPSLRYFIGDVRDQERLRRAMHGVDIVVHAAALKHVPACEYNPFEAVQTNIMGAKNIISAAIDSGVKHVMAISTDKAVNPVNLYGATKMVAEKLFVQGNTYAGADGPRFSCVRYGNVLGSRGSIVPLIEEQRAKGEITITDERMTRFWLPIERGVALVIQAIEQMKGGEIFVPKIPSMKITDLAEAMAPGVKRKIIGIRPGEKLHEILLSEDESRHTREEKDMYVILPEDPFWTEERQNAKPLPAGFRYASDTNTDWLSPDDFKKQLAATSAVKDHPRR